MAKDGALKYPVIAVNDAETKMMFDNRYGTGQSTLHGIMNATNVLLAGKNLVVVGYGWCGRGVAMRAKGMGSNVIVVEVNPRKALEAAMEGFRVMDMNRRRPEGDIFVTVTGDISVIRKEHFKLMKDQAIVCNSGHFNVELDLDDLGEDGEESVRGQGRRGRVRAEQRPPDLCAGRGPARESRLRFRPPARGHGHELREPGAGGQVYRGATRNSRTRSIRSPRRSTTASHSMKLETMGIKIEKLTKEQEKYLSSWSMGT